MEGPFPQQDFKVDDEGKTGGSQRGSNLEVVALAKEHGCLQGCLLCRQRELWKEQNSALTAPAIWPISCANPSTGLHRAPLKQHPCHPSTPLFVVSPNRARCEPVQVGEQSSSTGFLPPLITSCHKQRRRSIAQSAQTSTGGLGPIANLTSKSRSRPLSCSPSGFITPLN